MVSLEEPVQSHFPVVEEAFTPDEIQELLSLVQSEMPPVIFQSTSGSETTTTRATTSTRSMYSQEERKRRRMMSNRESARRSRWRKKRQVEDLTDEANKLKVENRELKNRLGLITCDYYMVQRETGRLVAESIVLKHKLAGLYQILVTHQQHHHHLLLQSSLYRESINY